MPEPCVELQWAACFPASSGSAEMGAVAPESGLSPQFECRSPKPKIGPSHCRLACSDQFPPSKKAPHLPPTIMTATTRSEDSLLPDAVLPSTGRANTRELVAKFGLAGASNMVRGLV